MTRRRLFEILRKVDSVLIVLCALIIPVGIVLAVTDLGASLLTDMGLGQEYAMAYIVAPIAAILMLLLDRFVLKILAASQSTILIVIMIILSMAGGFLTTEEVSLPLFYILALFLPKE